MKRTSLVALALWLAASSCAPASSTTEPDAGAQDPEPDAAPPDHVSGDPGPPAASPVATHSGPIAVSPDGARVFVVHPDADSVSVLRTSDRTIEREVLLAPARPAQDPTTGRYDPAVGPRALALDPTGARVYVTGERSGKVYALDANSGALLATADVCAEPVGVLASADGARVYVACSQDDEVVALRASDLAGVGSVACPRKPWALAWGADGALLVTHLLGPGVSAIDTDTLALRATWTLADGPATDDPRDPHGQVRGIYDAVVRPGTSELWVAHMMLGTDTPQPALDFERTVFAALSVLDASGSQLARLSVRVRPGDGGALGDVVSGPRALAFSPDGRFLYVADADSEDLLVVDAERRVEVALVRPLPGHLPEGLALAPDGALYLQERNTEDAARFVVDADGAPALDGAAIPTLTTDPMPAPLRLGQKLFYSANSDDAPVTQDHWVSCASCHLEGRSDAVTWRFEQGPRDTPSNAGGTRDTGFLFRTADRTRVQDYWKTINVEQGGHFDPNAPAHVPLLDAIAAYVNDAIPTPVPPRTDATLRARGEQVFAQAGCASCHAGPAFTDSGAGNPGLDLGGVVVLHNVGTCRTEGPSPDVAHQDRDGHARAACAFDTPALRGLWDSAPYLHDGSAATLSDVLDGPAAHVGGAQGLSAEDRSALLEFLRGL